MLGAGEGRAARRAAGRPLRGTDDAEEAIRLITLRPLASTGLPRKADAFSIGATHRRASLPVILLLAGTAISPHVQQPSRTTLVVCAGAQAHDTAKCGG